jgi:hypothetical protein
MRMVNFCQDGYREFLENISKNYRIMTFKSAYEEIASNPDENGICALRHDIDFCLESALEIAKIEIETGVTSSYHFLLNSENYNLLSKNSRVIVLEIASMGHEIALHFDLSAYEHNKKNKELQRQISFLQDIAQQEIISISFHNPSIYQNNELNIEEKYHGCLNTYSSYFNQYFSYVSDSRGHFREKDILRKIQQKHFNNLHFLMHPIWWVYMPSDRNQKLHSLVKAKCDALAENILSGYE